MPNPHKGEVGFECDGAVYTLRFSANALCELEDALDLGMNAIAGQLGDAGNLRLKTVRAVFWAGLHDRHPEVTLQAAGEIVTTLTLPGALELIGKAFAAAFPDADEGATTHPPQPGPATVPAKITTEAGTGVRSSENGASSASTTKPSGAARRGSSPSASPPARPS